MKRKFVFIVAVIFLVLLISGIAAGEYRRSDPQYTRPGIGTGLFASSSTGMPKDMCAQGQDFIVQIAPFGCSPSVVRTDLLEEQDVPVFCQLMATKMNPLIDVDAIDSIRFKGQWPEEVRSVDYHPALGALGVRGDLNNPIDTNIGYVILKLDQQKNASKMPEFIEGELTAELRYDIKNAFGVGDNVFYLPLLSDRDWEESKNVYSFWKGRGYLKAEDMSNNKAEISIYDDQRRIVSVDLARGESSHEISVPGFECIASLILKLKGVENPDIRARINVNGEIFELKKDESFLDGAGGKACKVLDVVKYGYTQKVSIRCKGEDKRNKFDLTISPRIKLDIGGSIEEKNVGDFLFKGGEGEDARYYYLAYAGMPEYTTKEKDLQIYTIGLIEDQGEQLPTGYLSDVDYLARSRRYEGEAGIQTPADILKNMFMGVAGVATEAANRLISGTQYTELSVNETDAVGGKQLTFLGFAEAQDFDIGGSEAEEYYGQALDDYEQVIGSFAKTHYPKTSVVEKAEEAFVNKIKLAYNVGQRRKVVEFCEEFETMYPSSSLKFEVDKYCNNKAALSNSGLISERRVIDGRVKEITLEGVYEPDLEEYSAVLFVEDPDGETSKLILKKDSVVFLNRSANHFIQLREIKDEETIRAKVSLPNSKDFWENLEDSFIGDNEILQLKKPKTFGSKYKFTVTRINLKKLAKVSLDSKINYQKSEANFSFKIGIEKRGINLAPAEIKKKIDSLTRSISKWESISGKLGNFVKGMKATCIGVGAYLTIKNFLANTKGKSIARRQVMRGDGGWYEICENYVRDNEAEYPTIEKCLSKFSDEIDRDVDTYYKILTAQNNRIKEIQEPLEEAGLLGSKSVDNDKLKTEYLKHIKSDLIRDLEAKYGETVQIQNEDINLKDLVNSLDSDKVSFEEIRELELYSKLKGSGELNNLTSQRLTTRIGDTYKNLEESNKIDSFIDDLSVYSENVRVSVRRLKDAEKEVYTGGEITKDSNPYGIRKGTPVQAYYDLTTSKKYLLELDKLEHRLYGVKNVYLEETGEKLSDDDAKPIKDSIPALEYVDRGSYNHPYISSLGSEVPLLRYFETDPYKGLPAIVPFDLEEGWYVSVRQAIPSLGEIRSYDESGLPHSFFICNVGLNGKEQNRGGDDECQSFVEGQPGERKIYGLTASETGRLLDDALEAINDAKTSYKSGVREVIISTSRGTFEVEVGEPAVEIPDLQCQDFMSPADCKLLFNVCDPVVCPSSRCDLGGKYAVRDVVQSGIIGSIALCAPNFVGFGGDVYVPVCLSGVKAGLDGWVSVQKSYRDCLQHNLDTGETIGVCDEIHSIYACEFFWRHGIGFAKLLVPKIIGLFAGQSVRGGGEYLSVADAWQSAEQSVGYFTQYYAENTFNAFKARSTDEVGGEACKLFVSGVYPASGDVLDTLTEPDSPPQFYGNLDEIPFTTVTNPPISQYKVFYHIYAGDDRGAYYKVYLRRSAGSSFYQDTDSQVYLAGGYIPKGESVSETPDFTASAGYTELCIQVNDQLECGFKQVSTNFALDYIRDKYVADQADKEDIRTFKECVAGSMSLYALANPNIQEGVDEAIAPSIYNRGLVRVCATENPDRATDTRETSSENPRWVPVGYCDDPKMICWLDLKSVDEALEMDFLAEDSLEEKQEAYLEALAAGKDYWSEEIIDSKIKNEIEAELNWTIRLGIIEETLDKTFYDYQKAHLLLMRGDAYGALAVKSYEDSFIPHIERETSEFKLEPGKKFRFWFNDELHELVVESIVDGRVYFHIGPNRYDLGLWEDISIVLGGEDDDKLYIKAKEINEEKQYVILEMRAVPAKDIMGEINEELGDRSLEYDEEHIKELLNNYPQGGIIFESEGLHYRFLDEWVWSKDPDEYWISISGLGDAISSDVFGGSGGADATATAGLPKSLSDFVRLSDTEKIFILNLHAKTYEQGLRMIIDRTIEEKEKLETQVVEMSWEKEFEVRVYSSQKLKVNAFGKYIAQVDGFEVFEFELKYDVDEWFWRRQKSDDVRTGWFSVEDTKDTEPPFSTLLKVLQKRKEFYSGSRIIFDINIREDFDNIDVEEDDFEVGDLGDVLPSKQVFQSFSSNGKSIYFKYDGGWLYDYENEGWKSVSDFTVSFFGGAEMDPEFVSLIEALQTADYKQGERLIYSFNYRDYINKVLNRKGRDYLLCSDCGTDSSGWTLGLGNNCDEKECLALKIITGENCVYYPGSGVFPGGKCEEEGGEVDFGFKSKSIEHIEEIVEQGEADGVISRDCSDYLEEIVEASEKYDLQDPLLLLAMIHEESSCNPDAVSPDGKDTGLMQINIIHCGEHGLPVNIADCKRELKKPEKSIDIGASMLKDHYNRYGSSSKDAVYNAQVDKWCSSSMYRNRYKRYVKWDRALRAYNGFGCDNLVIAGYVERVRAVYDSLAGITRGFGMQVEFLLSTGDFDERQVQDSDPSLITLLNCINSEYDLLENKKITVTSITDSGLYEGTCDLDDPTQIYKNDSYCVHRKGSCHYYRQSGMLYSRAADLRLRGYDKGKLKQAIEECKKKVSFAVYKKDEGDHLHVSIKNCETGQEDYIPPGDDDIESEIGFCDSCEDCSRKLNGDYEKVVLTTDITNYHSNCIEFGADNLIFDCNAYIIDGDGSGSTYGFYLRNKDGNTIDNCFVQEFGEGIRLEGSSSNTITSMKLSDNGIGLSIYSSGNNHIESNVIFSNTLHGIMLSNSFETTMTRNRVFSNGRGLSLDYSSTNNIYNNYFCESTFDYDIFVGEGSLGNSGIDNECDHVWGWEEGGNSGCTRNCEKTYCNSCEECSEKLDNAELGDTIKLDKDLEVSSGDRCIVLDDKEGVTFDCQEYTIENTPEAASGQDAVVIDRGSDNTIKNCKLRNFDTAIYLDRTDSNLLMNNELSYDESVQGIRGNSGIYCFESDLNSILNNKISSFEWGIGLDYCKSNRLRNNEICGNRVDIISIRFSEDNSGSGNMCKEPSYWNDDGVDGCTYECPSA
jgi:parallel beta-helix repeat protein